MSHPSVRPGCPDCVSRKRPAQLSGLGVLPKRPTWVYRLGVLPGRPDCVSPKRPVQVSGLVALPKLPAWVSRPGVPTACRSNSLCVLPECLPPVVHPGGTFGQHCWDVQSRYSDKTPWQNTQVGRLGKTPKPDTWAGRLNKHAVGTPRLDTGVRHLGGTPRCGNPVRTLRRDVWVTRSRDT